MPVNGLKEIVNLIKQPQTLLKQSAVQTMATQLILPGY